MVLNKKTSLETLAVWEDIRISRKGDLLILENSRIRRVLDLSTGAPRTISLQTADGTELARRRIRFATSASSECTKRVKWKCRGRSNPSVAEKNSATFLKRSA